MPEAKPVLHYSCPSCGTRHSAPDSHEGRKHECTTCGQRLQIPRRPRNRTILATAEDGPGEDEPEVAAPPPRRRRQREADFEVDERDEVEPDDGEDEEERQMARPFRCPACGSSRPQMVSRLASEAWVFIVLGVLFWPLIILGIFYRDKWQDCADCGEKGRKVSGPNFSV